MKKLLSINVLIALMSSFCTTTMVVCFGMQSAIADTFNFQFSGRGSDSGATATGSFTTSDTTTGTLAGVFNASFNNVSALNVLVAGASAGNGTFALTNFSSWFFTSSGALNFTTNLVGQPPFTDFNLFGTGSPSPYGTTYFTLTSNGGSGTPMTLSCFYLQGAGNLCGNLPPSSYWKGGLDAAWNKVIGVNTNWATDSGGLTDKGSIPGATTDVHFYATGAANLATTLGQNFTINSLTMDGGTATSAVSIAAGNTLTINTGGITINSGAGTLTLNNGVALGASQSWLNNSANLFTVAGNVDNNTNTLTVDGSGSTSISGVISNGALTKSGTGAVFLET